MNPGPIRDAAFHFRSPDPKKLQEYCRRPGAADMAEVLCEKGADVNVKNFMAFTPLHMAAQLGHLQIVRLLVVFGASLVSRDINCHTPLDIASLNDNLDVAEFLYSNSLE
ncbi:GA-binding protein subunit beta-1-like isoform X2 [Periplaneta americana]|uniref:GA-binding protein subunit beta-1-like isoform X2 n=1 Tax=Periplaneta americana TaxID=6978 RepID=UPI0037E8FB5B